MTAVRSSVRRPVRVTIEGEAYHPDSGSDVLIVVRPDGGKIVLPSVSVGVTVEDIEPPRVWTDGDACSLGRDVWARRDGRWHLAGTSADLSDAAVARSLNDPSVSVLRYQHGGDQ